MNFSINLATRVYVDFKKVNICLLTAGAILSLWLLFSIYTCFENAAQMNKFAEYKAKLSSAAGTKKVSEVDYSAFLAEVKSVNAILYKNSYDWLSLLANLERLVPDGVALKRLEPSDKGATLKLSATARNFPAVRAFMENLENSKVFSEIYLTDQVTTNDDGRKMLNFTVTCKASSL